MLLYNDHSSIKKILPRWMSLLYYIQRLSPNDPIREKEENGGPIPLINEFSFRPLIIL